MSERPDLDRLRKIAAERALRDATPIMNDDDLQALPHGTRLRDEQGWRHVWDGTNDLIIFPAEIIAFPDQGDH